MSAPVQSSVPEDSRGAGCHWAIRAARQAGALAAGFLILGLCLLSCASAAAPVLVREYYEMGNEWLQMGKWDKAGAAYEKALSYDRTFIAASYNLARALAEGGAYGRAQQILEDLLTQDPDNVRLITLRAYAYHLAGDDKAALASYKRASELNPYDAATLKNLAFLLADAGQEVEAARILRELYTVDSSDAQVLRRLALLESKLEPGPPADALLTAYLAREPKDAQALRVRAQLRENGEFFALALEDWTALVKADESDAEAWFRIARIRLVVAGDAAGGLEALKKALAAKYSDAKAASALLAALPEAERDRPAVLLRAAGLVE